MVVAGIGALASLGLALPTGLAFGYGYGYGVRAGYSSFKQPSSEVQKLKLSANPVTGALGAGLQSAEERTNVPVLGNIPKNVTPQPSLATETSKITQETTPHKVDGKLNMDLYYRAPDGRVILKTDIKSREDYQDFIAGRYPYNSHYSKVRTRSPKYSSVKQ